AYRAGVRKLAPTIAAQYACDVFKPRCIIAIGLAGELESRARRGRVVVASGAIQHDIDARPLTDTKGVIPGLGIRLIEADSAVSEMLLRAARYKAEDAEAGLVLTGDQIVTSRSVRDGLAREFPDAACIDMETAAVAQVAHQNRVPWSALRVTSANADQSFEVNAVM